MRAIYFNHLNPNNGYQVVEIEDTLDVFCEMLHCRCIDITTRSIAGKNFDIIVDDEGLFKDPMILGAMSPEDKNCALVGSLLITDTADAYGELTDLANDDILRIITTTHNVLIRDGEEFNIRPLLHIDWPI